MLGRVNLRPSNGSNLQKKANQLSYNKINEQLKNQVSQTKPHHKRIPGERRNMYKQFSCVNQPYFGQASTNNMCICCQVSSHRWKHCYRSIQQQNEFMQFHQNRHTPQELARRLQGRGVRVKVLRQFHNGVLEVQQLKSTTTSLPTNLPKSNNPRRIRQVESNQSVVVPTLLVAGIDTDVDHVRNLNPQAHAERRVDQISQQSFSGLWEKVDRVEANLVMQAQRFQYFVPKEEFEIQKIVVAHLEDRLCLDSDTKQFTDLEREIDELKNEVTSRLPILQNKISGLQEKFEVALKEIDKLLQKLESSVLGVKDNLASLKSRLEDKDGQLKRGLEKLQIKHEKLDQDLTVEVTHLKNYIDQKVSKYLR